MNEKLLDLYEQDRKLFAEYQDSVRESEKLRDAWFEVHRKWIRAYQEATFEDEIKKRLELRSA